MGAIRNLQHVWNRPNIPERTPSLNDFSFNNGSKGYLYKIEQVVKSVSNQLNVIILQFCSLAMLSGRPLNFVIWSHQIEISGDVSRLSHARARTKFRTLSGLRKRRLILLFGQRAASPGIANAG